MGRRRSRRYGDPGGELRPLADLVAGVYPSKEPAEVAALRAFGWWERAVPERVSRNARPVRVERGALIVHATTSVWAQELDMLKDELLARLRQVAPKSGIRAVRVRVGKLPPAPPRVQVARPRAPVIPATELPDALARELAGVGDDDVRAAVAAAASVGLGRPGGRGER